MRRRISQYLVPAVALAGALGSGAWLVTQETPAWTSSTSTATFDGQDRGYGAGMMGGYGDGTGMMGGYGDGTGMMGGYGDGTGMMGGYGAGTGMMDGYGNGTGMMGGYRNGSGMMGWVNDDAGPVADLDGARERAAAFARSLEPDLRVGEVMRFSNHYYAQLVDADGSRATEVLVDPTTGSVQVEPGPAMMWNSRYGMASDAGAPEVSAEEARAAAERALDGAGTTVGPAEELPGYYTLHTLRDGEVDGMVSVNAVTGAVWTHSWHGTFVEMSEDG